jgi:hypothetical protein
MDPEKRADEKKKTRGITAQERGPKGVFINRYQKRNKRNPSQAP